VNRPFCPPNKIGDSRLAEKGIDNQRYLSAPVLAPDGSFPEELLALAFISVGGSMLPFPPPGSFRIL
jgi:hypothetical protein